MMICLICRQVRLTFGFISVKLDRAEIKLTITNVPAIVCPDCGEAFVDDKVAARLLQIAKTNKDRGIKTDTLVYSVGS